MVHMVGHKSDSILTNSDDFQGYTLTFQSVQSSRLLLSHKIDLANVSLADQLDLVKASWANFNVTDFDRIGTVCSSESGCIANLAWRRDAIRGRDW